MSALHTSLVRLAAALGFWLANVSLHLEFSNWIVTSYGTPFGDFVPRDHTQAIAALVCLVFGLFLFMQWRRGEKRLVTACAWGVAFTAMFASMAFITTTVVEMIHFLQYGLLAYLLAFALDPDRQAWPLLTLMFLATFLGIVDELNQYFYLTQNNSTYIDFNDFVLNQVGACAGLLTWYGFRIAPHWPVKWAGLQRVTLGAYVTLAFVVLTLAVSGHLRYTPAQTVPPGGIDNIDGSFVIFFQREPGLLGSTLPTFTTGRYFVMGWLEGTLVMLLVTGLIHLFKFFSRLEGSNALLHHP